MTGRKVSGHIPGLSGKGLSKRLINTKQGWGGNLGDKRKNFRPIPWVKMNRPENGKGYEKNGRELRKNTGERIRNKPDRFCQK